MKGAEAINPRSRGAPASGVRDARLLLRSPSAALSLKLLSLRARQEEAARPPTGGRNRPDATAHPPSQSSTAKWRRARKSTIMAPYPDQVAP